MSLHLAKLLSTRLRSGFIQRHRQTYRSRYPATDFIRGVTNLTKVTARKSLGLVFLFVILSQYDKGWDILDHTFECRSVENHCATGSMPCNDATVLVDSNSTVCPGDRTEPVWTTVVAKTKSKNMQRPPRRQGPTWGSWDRDGASWNEDCLQITSTGEVKLQAF